MSIEPCGSLPVSSITIGAHYCHHHLAWSATASTWCQSSDEDVEVLHTARMAFGPFDDEDEVRAWMLRALLAMDDLLP